MSGHIEQIRQRYDQFSRGDIQGATQDWASDFVWQGGNSAALPMGGTHYGKPAALQVLARDVAVWEEFTMSPDEYFEDGDTVVVLGHSAIKEDGQSATTAFVHVWRWRGDQISRFQLVTDTRGLEWADAHVGDYVHIPAGTPHAHRNVSPDPAIDLIITTARLGQFFAEAGRPVTHPQHPPTPGDVARFTAVAVRYGHAMGTPEENAAVGIQMPKFAAGQ